MPPTREKSGRYGNSIAPKASSRGEREREKKDSEKPKKKPKKNLVQPVCRGGTFTTLGACEEEKKHMERMVACWYGNWR